MATTAVRWLCVGFMAVSTANSPAFAASPEPVDPWPDLVRDVFDGRPLVEGTGVVAIEMPDRAEDAAVVPVTLWLRAPEADGRTVRAVTLVIDQNPAPVAAKFQLGAGAGAAMISTRVRVDSYTNVHAVAELSDGTLHVAETFIKASGGCSAPAAKNADEAKANLGQMRLRQFAQRHIPPDGLREVQIMIRHPNNSGLQMDQITRLYTPAFFVRDLRIWQADQLVLKVDAGISISENPTVRFTYRPDGARTLRAEAVDSDGHDFTGEWPVEAGAME